MRALSVTHRLEIRGARIGHHTSGAGTGIELRAELQELCRLPVGFEHPRHNQSCSGDGNTDPNRGCVRSLFGQHELWLAGVDLGDYCDSELATARPDWSVFGPVFCCLPLPMPPPLAPPYAFHPCFLGVVHVPPRLSQGKSPPKSVSDRKRQVPQWRSRHGLAVTKSLAH